MSAGRASERRGVPVKRIVVNQQQHQQQALLLRAACSAGSPQEEGAESFVPNKKTLCGAEREREGTWDRGG